MEHCKIASAETRKEAIYVWHAEWELCLWWLDQQVSGQITHFLEGLNDGFSRFFKVSVKRLSRTLVIEVKVKSKSMKVNQSISESKHNGSGQWHSIFRNRWLGSLQCSRQFSPESLFKGIQLRGGTKLSASIQTKERLDMNAGSCQETSSLQQMAKENEVKTSKHDRLL